MYSPSNSNDEQEVPSSTKQQKVEVDHHQNKNQNEVLDHLLEQESTDNNTQSPGFKNNDKNNNFALHTSKGNKQKEGWKMDGPTLKFSVLMFLICLGLTIAFSILAKRDADNSNNEVPIPQYIHDECYGYRPFTTWRIFSESQLNSTSTKAKTCVEKLNLKRGVPRACTADADCQLSIPNYCHFGDSKLLTCKKGFCALKTASLPITLDKPEAGVCPVEDLCGNFLGTGSSAPTTQELGSKPVICVTEIDCDRKLYPQVTCQELFPNITTTMAPSGV